MNQETINALAQAYRIALAETDQERQGQLVQALDGVSKAVDRTEQRRLSDQKTDQDRRRLVGARVPVYTANRYTALAAEMKLSLYQLVCDALEDYRKKMEQDLGIEYDGHRYFDPNQIEIGQYIEQYGG